MDMKGYDYIKAKQINWALNRGLKLQGSEGERGEKAYTLTLEENLFEPLLEEVKEKFMKGDGQELKPNSHGICKMQAVHASSALVVNVFQYWKKIGDYSPILQAFKLPKMHCTRCEFEEKFPIYPGSHPEFPIPPNIDIIFYCENANKIIAIESKFSESYSSYRDPEKYGIKSKYFKEELLHLWEDIPHIKQLAEKICPKDNHFKFLHTAQLIKHILGLKAKYKKENFYLVYLWYPVPGEEGYIHEQEIREVAEVFKKDGINFLALTYQELIINLAENCREKHSEYIKYITGRYL